MKNRHKKSFNNSSDQSYDKKSSSSCTVSTTHLSDDDTNNNDSTKKTYPANNRRNGRNKFGLPRKSKRPNQRKRGKRRLKKKSKKSPMKSIKFDRSEMRRQEECAKYVALDCEMVGIGSNNESALARVCVVSWDEEVLFDTFVKVPEEITDYRTFVSGVTEEDLVSEYAIELEDCRNIVSSLIEGKILVGHALKNDLNALKLEHPWWLTRDTAKYEPYMRYCDKTGQMKPRKLKDLVYENIGIEIQMAGEAHCPYEDAVSALLLYKTTSYKWEKVMEYKLQKTKEIVQQQKEYLEYTLAFPELE